MYKIWKICLRLQSMDNLIFWDFILSFLANEASCTDVHCIKYQMSLLNKGALWLYGSWIYNYLCNQCLSPLKLWVRTLFIARCTRSICDNVCQWLVAGWWFSLGNPVSYTNKTDHYDITEILLKVVINTINLTIAILIKQSKKKPSSTLLFCFSI